MSKFKKLCKLNTLLLALSMVLFFAEIAYSECLSCRTLRLEIGQGDDTYMRIKQQEFKMLMEKGSDYSAVNKWLEKRNWDILKGVIEGKKIMPAYVEIHPTNKCNFNCRYCKGGSRNIEENAHLLSKEDLVKMVNEIYALSPRTLIRFSGFNGEPLMNPATIEAAKEAFRLGMSWSLVTNGTLLTPEVCEVLLGASFVNISLDAGTNSTFSALKGISSNNNTLDKVFSNVARLVKLKKENNSNVRIGVMFLLQPENWKEVREVSKRAKEMGVDLLHIRTTHLDSQEGAIKQPEEVAEIYKELNTIKEEDATDTYRVNILQDEEEAREKLQGNYPRPTYNKCYAALIEAAVSADGVSHACCHYGYGDLGPQGNLKEHSFQEIWNSELREKVIARDPSKMCTYCAPADAEFNNLIIFLKETQAKYSGVLDWIEKEFVVKKEYRKTIEEQWSIVERHLVNMKKAEGIKAEKPFFELNMGEKKDRYYELDFNRNTIVFYLNSALTDEEVIEISWQAFRDWYAVLEDNITLGYSIADITGGDVLSVVRMITLTGRNYDEIGFYRAADIAGKTVLDAGTGIGLNAINIAKRGAEKVISVDVSDYMLEYAGIHSNYAQVSNLTFLKGNICSLPLDEASADTYFAEGILFRLPPSLRRMALKEAYRALKEGGPLIISDVEFTIIDDEKVFLGWDMDTWRDEIIKAGFIFEASQGLSIEEVVKERGTLIYIRAQKPILPRDVSIGVIDMTPTRYNDVLELSIQCPVPLSNKPYLEEKWTIDQHLTSLEEKGIIPRNITGYGNLFYCEGFIAYRDGVLFHRKGEPITKKAYSCFIVFNDGRFAIKDVKFTDENKIIDVYAEEDIKGEVKWLVSGPKIVDRGTIVNWRTSDYFKDYSDPRHLFLFPAAIFSNNPDKKGDVFRAMLWEDLDVPEMQPEIDRKKELARKGEYINLSLDKFKEYGYARKDLKRELELTGYSEEEFYFTDTNLVIKLRPSRYQHHALGITREGKVISLGVTGRNRQSGVTLEQFGNLCLERNVVEAIMLDQGGDVFAIENNTTILLSLTDRENFSSIIILGTDRFLDEALSILGWTDSRPDSNFGLNLDNIKTIVFNGDYVDEHIDELSKAFSEGKTIDILVTTEEEKQALENKLISQGIFDQERVSILVSDPAEIKTILGSNAYVDFRGLITTPADVIKHKDAIIALSKAK